MVNQLDTRLKIISKIAEIGDYIRYHEKPLDRGESVEVSGDLPWNIGKPGWHIVRAIAKYNIDNPRKVKYSSEDIKALVNMTSELKELVDKYKKELEDSQYKNFDVSVHKRDVSVVANPYVMKAILNYVHGSFIVKNYVNYMIDSEPGEFYVNLSRNILLRVHDMSIRVYDVKDVIGINITDELNGRVTLYCMLF